MLKKYVLFDFGYVTVQEWLHHKPYRYKELADTEKTSRIDCKSSSKFRVWLQPFTVT